VIGLNRSGGAYRHKNRGLDGSVIGHDISCACLATLVGV